MNGEMGISNSKAIEKCTLKKGIGLEYIYIYIYMAIGGTKGC
jgi:hypothetical protein